MFLKIITNINIVLLTVSSCRRIAIVVFLKPNYVLKLADIEYLSTCIEGLEIPVASCFLNINDSLGKVFLESLNKRDTLDVT